jgi:hypothetical protein
MFAATTDARASKSVPLRVVMISTELSPGLIRVREDFTLGDIFPRAPGVVFSRADGISGAVLFCVRYK